MQLTPATFTFMDTFCSTAKLLMHDNLNLIMPFILKQRNTTEMNLKPRQHPSVCTSIDCAANHVLLAILWLLLGASTNK